MSEYKEQAEQARKALSDSMEENQAAIRKCSAMVFTNQGRMTAQVQQLRETIEHVERAVKTVEKT